MRDDMTIDDCVLHAARLAAEKKKGIDNVDFSAFSPEEQLQIYLGLTNHQDEHVPFTGKHSSGYGHLYSLFLLQQAKSLAHQIEIPLDAERQVIAIAQRLRSKLIRRSGTSTEEWTAVNNLICEPYSMADALQDATSDVSETLVSGVINAVRFAIPGRDAVQSRVTKIADEAIDDLAAQWKTRNDFDKYWTRHHHENRMLLDLLPLASENAKILGLDNLGLRLVYYFENGVVANGHLPPSLVERMVRSLSAGGQNAYLLQAKNAVILDPSVVEKSIKSLGGPHCRGYLFASQGNNWEEDPDSRAYTGTRSTANIEERRVRRLLSILQEFTNLSQDDVSRTADSYFIAGFFEAANTLYAWAKSSPTVSIPTRRANALTDCLLGEYGYTDSTNSYDDFEEYLTQLMSIPGLPAETLEDNKSRVRERVVELLKKHDWYTTEKRAWLATTFATAGVMPDALTATQALDMVGQTTGVDAQAYLSYIEEHHPRLAVFARENLLD